LKKRGCMRKPHLALRITWLKTANAYLILMGIPWIQAPSEGEAQAAHMVKRGDADYCASQDYDSLLFGAPSLLET
jgi:flap endonuclease-1